MEKTGFRGERKENPHPVHILSYSETSPKERGNVVTGKGKRNQRISKFGNEKMGWCELHRQLN